jgi:CspA family cold shock protein
MNTGIVKFFNETKGFGFIIDDETKNEIFVHATGLQDLIKQNDRVSFNTQDSKKGKIANNVKILK